MTNAVAVAQYGGLGATKNRIINGAMQIDQRNAGSSTTLSTYCLDRWNGNTSGVGVVSVQQVSDAPAGFTKSLRITVSTADSSVTGDDYCQLIQQPEGLNMADFGWGTANAQNVTVSFWVKSSVTGTYCVGFRDTNAAYSYVTNYTINSANTWEYKTITVPGATVGTWNTDNTRWGYFTFALYQGPTSQGTANTWVSGNARATSSISNTYPATIGNTWQVTGVQLEKGSTATSFDYRPYGTELQLCQRYYEKSFAIGTAPQNGIGVANNGTIYGLGGVAYTTGSIRTPQYKFSVTKRTAPAITLWSPASGQGGAADGNWTSYPGVWTNSTTTTMVDGVTHEYGFAVELNRSGTFTIGFSYLTGGNWSASAEL